ncbi:hypothetical protein IEO21_05265 [Rhodonia placenta]|uniref:Uncharacterized protein n=1 Tax=Rhodonia placenta TaxID=104341 RepID=A0A8H7U299_9APHY|nr:hypothetical protein IEO21_05265 [Postia placenta]
MSTRTDSSAVPTPPAPAGRSDARFETSAAWAAAEASTNTLSNEVNRNASQLQTAAGQAASEAQQTEPQVVSAVNELEAGRAVNQQMDQATTQGMFDVESAKATASSAVEQARSMANSAYQTAQSLFNGSQTSDNTTAGNVSSTVQSTASSALQTGKEYLASAQTVAQPHIDKAKTMLSGTATWNDSAASSRPSEVPASTAPFESGSQVVGNPYPATTTGQNTKVGEV